MKESSNEKLVYFAVAVAGTIQMLHSEIFRFSENLLSLWYQPKL